MPARMNDDGSFHGSLVWPERYTVKAHFGTPARRIFLKKALFSLVITLGTGIAELAVCRKPKIMPGCFTRPRRGNFSGLVFCF
jgi:hypothetical protein